MNNDNNNNIDNDHEEQREQEEPITVTRSSRFRPRENGSYDSLRLDKVLMKWWNERDCYHHNENPAQHCANRSSPLSTLNFHNHNNHHNHHYNHYHHPHPLITLFFDGNKNVTIGVLSSPYPDDVSIATYFRSRVEEGTAQKRSPLYFELDGFVRENASHIRKVLFQHHHLHLLHANIGGSGSSTGGKDKKNNNESLLISIAMGSLEASDAAQQKALLEQQKQQRIKQRQKQRMRQTNTFDNLITTPSETGDDTDTAAGAASINVTTTMSTNSTTTENREDYDFENYEDDETTASTPEYLDLLERALEIARLVRLDDDLDVLSIYFLRLASKTCGRIASRIARNRILNDTDLTITPFVDGISLTGYSNFVRHNNNHNIDDDNDAENDATEPPIHQGPAASPTSMPLVRHPESGRLVEYQRCCAIRLKSSHLHKVGTFLPELQQIDDENNDIYSRESSISYRQQERRQQQQKQLSNEFTWNCEEIALANLHRWWGDIVIRDYVGQKLVVSWTPHPADAVLFNDDYYNKNKRKKNNDNNSNNITTAPTTTSNNNNNAEISRSASRNHPPGVALVTLRLETGPIKGIHTFFPRSYQQQQHVVDVTCHSHHQSNINNNINNNPHNNNNNNYQRHHNYNNSNNNNSNNCMFGGNNNNSCPSPFSPCTVGITLNVLESESKSMDDAVTTWYKGRARVETLHVNFLSLVKLSARAVVPRVRQQYVDSLETRPLLPNEIQYLELLEEAAAVPHSSLFW